MKSILIIFSLAVNAALIGGFFSPAVSSRIDSLTHPGASVSRSSTTGKPDATAANPTLTPGGNEASLNTVAPESANAPRWETLPQDADLVAFVAELRAAGVPAAIIRATVSARLGSEFVAFANALRARYPAPPYWKSYPSISLFGDVRAAAELQALSRKHRQLEKEALGEDDHPVVLKAPRLREYWQYGDLPSDFPPEKLQQLKWVVADYTDLTQQVYLGSQGIFLPEDRERLTYLNKERENDIKAMLTPEEYESYQLRASSTANNLRTQLAAFQPTEAEYRAIFKIQQAIEEQNSPAAATGSNPTKTRELQLAQLQGVLSPERFAEFKQITDPAYQQTSLLVARLELPSSATAQIVAIQQDVQQRASSLRSDRNLPAEARAVQLAALSQEATTKLSSALGGKRGLDAYRQNGGGWLQSLQSGKR